MIPNTGTFFLVPQRVKVVDGEYAGQIGTLTDVRKPWGLELVIATVELDSGVEYHCMPHNLITPDNEPIKKTEPD